MKFGALISTLIVTTGVALATTSVPAAAVTFGFNNIAGGDTVGDAYKSDFSFDVTQSGSDKVLFKFLNNSSGTNALKQFAFSVDNSISSLLSNMMVDIGNVGIVDFDANPQNLSQSNNISGWDGTTFGGGTSGANKNSVQSGEALGVSFSANYNNVLAALSAGKLQVGIHVGSLPGGASDTYVSNSYYVPPGNPPVITQPVPESGSILGVIAFGIGGLLIRKRDKNIQLETVKLD
ncbi:hypothetical protein BV372_11785 [Nostoc sp. T09]|nr:hypothetical protein BV372_11785 [Nostoc sp. T09]